MPSKLELDLINKYTIAEQFLGNDISSCIFSWNWGYVTAVINAIIHVHLAVKLIFPQKKTTLQRIKFHQWAEPIELERVNISFRNPEIFSNERKF